MIKFYAETTQGTILIENFDNDGITHINVYSRAQTELGKAASNFAMTQIVHPEHGIFSCMESYWMWVATGMMHHNLKTMTSGYVKKFAKRFHRVFHDNFDLMMLQGLHLKLQQHPAIYTLLMESDPDLPFAHYYVYSGEQKDMFERSRFWLMELEAIRQGKPLDPMLFTKST